MDVQAAVGFDRLPSSGWVMSEGAPQLRSFDLWLIIGARCVWGIRGLVGSLRRQRVIRKNPKVCVLPLAKILA
jgi:hypothetical protein